MLVGIAGDVKGSRVHRERIHEVSEHDDTSFPVNPDPSATSVSTKVQANSTTGLGIKLEYIAFPSSIPKPYTPMQVTFKVTVKFLPNIIKDPVTVSSIVDDSLAPWATWMKKDHVSFLRLFKQAQRRPSTRAGSLRI